MRYGLRPLDAAALAQAFGARYLVVSKNARRECPGLAASNWAPVYEDPTASVYPLR
jgi:hypothetical protein